MLRRLVIVIFHNNRCNNEVDENETAEKNTKDSWHNIMNFWIEMLKFLFKLIKNKFKKIILQK